jgi:hypothetical protein
VVHGEDLSAIKMLNRAYGYYVDAGLWDDVADLFADDATANYPNGTFLGREHIRRHLIENLGGGKIGLADGRLYVHTVFMPVVHLDAGGTTAKGRWRTLAMIGRYGASASWAEGVYEMSYVKRNGTWRIAQLDYYPGFGAPYEGGWAKPVVPGAGSQSRFQLTFPPDRPPPEVCPGYPTACVAPFHYKNPVSGGGGSAWPAPVATAGGPSPDLADLGRRARRLADEQEIQNLINIWGYYIDRGQWSQAADLFASKGTIELGQQGVYVGKKRIRQFLATFGPEGGKEGWLFDHLELQPIVNFTPDLGYARSREFAMTGTFQGKGSIADGVYENVFVREGGVWKIRALRYSPTFITDYDQGWAKSAEPAPGPSAALPPDRPPTEAYQIYPKAHIVRFSFTNPATGKAPHYPDAAAPSETLSIPTAPARSGAAPSLDEAERLMARVKSVHEIENLEDAYGYYLDKNLWNDLADLFATDGSMELAKRGAYIGRERVRSFLFAAFGPQGPPANRLGNHIQLQPVIHLSADGQSARIRSRMLQQLGSPGGRASWGGAIYENELVQRDGVWQFKSVHAYNTLAAGYDGGWMRSAGRTLPGPSKTLPPDRPASLDYEMFPAIAPAPYHYPNPVTGKP